MLVEYTIPHLREQLNYMTTNKMINVLVDKMFFFLLLYQFLTESIETFRLTINEFKNGQEGAESDVTVDRREEGISINSIPSSSPIFFGSVCFLIENRKMNKRIGNINEHRTSRRHSVLL